MTLALFDTLEAAQAYCDERDAELGYPVLDKHPRTGELRIVTARCDVPRPHPSGDGRAWCTVDETAPSPKGAAIVDELPKDWQPKAIEHDGKTDLKSDTAIAFEDRRMLEAAKRAMSAEPTKR